VTARLNISDRFFQNAGARIPIARSAILAPPVFFSNFFLSVEFGSR
jgi:hypothetical protein